MKLPKLDLPCYKVTLPVSGKQVEYRPYTVKEETILMMAASSKPEEGASDLEIKEHTTDVTNAIIQIVENCCSGFDSVHELDPVDFEWIFVQLRKTSVGEHVELEFEVANCEKEGCKKIINALLNLNHVKIEEIQQKTLDELGVVKAKSGKYTIPLTETSGIVIDLKLVTEFEDDTEVMYKLTDSIYKGSDVFAKSDFDLADFRQFVSDIPSPIMKKIEKFFMSLPKLTCEVSGKCKQCDLDYKYKLEGITDFFG